MPDLLRVAAAAVLSAALLPSPKALAASPCAEEAEYCEPGTLIRHQLSRTIAGFPASEHPQVLDNILANAHLWIEAHCDFRQAVVTTTLASAPITQPPSWVGGAASSNSVAVAVTCMKAEPLN